LGAREGEGNAIGFGSQTKTGEDDRALKEFFKPELRNRIDQICKFVRLDTLAVKKIVVKFLDELKTSLAAKNINFTASEEVIDLLAREGYDPKMGARPLSRKIDQLLRVPLSKRILFDRLDNCNIQAVLANNVVEFVIERIIVPVVGNDGIIEFPGT
jgi:ATP-dependent Clp protease ATP-binding subunit ClpA